MSAGPERPDPKAGPRTGARPVPRLHRARRRMRAWVIGVAAVALVAVVITAVVGGFGDRPIVRLAAAERGRSIDAGELDVSLTSARITASDPAVAFALADERYLVVHATVVNMTDAPVDSYTVTLRVQGASIAFADAPTFFTRTADAESVTDFQPGLPERVAWIWSIPKGTVVPSGDLTSVLLTRARKLGDPVYGDDSYGPLGAVARVELPVTISPTPSATPTGSSS